MRTENITMLALSMVGLDPIKLSNPNKAAQVVSEALSLEAGMLSSGIVVKPLAVPGSDGDHCAVEVLIVGEVDEQEFKYEVDLIERALKLRLHPPVMVTGFMGKDEFEGDIAKAQLDLFSAVFKSFMAESFS
jgi:hypothetical protein